MRATNSLPASDAKNASTLRAASGPMRAASGVCFSCVSSSSISRFSSAVRALRAAFSASSFGGFFRDCGETSMRS